MAKFEKSNHLSDGSVICGKCNQRFMFKDFSDPDETKILIQGRETTQGSRVGTMNYKCPLRIDTPKGKQLCANWIGYIDSIPDVLSDSEYYQEIPIEETPKPPVPTLNKTLKRKGSDIELIAPNPKKQNFGNENNNDNVYEKISKMMDSKFGEALCGLRTDIEVLVETINDVFKNIKPPEYSPEEEDKRKEESF